RGHPVLADDGRAADGDRGVVRVAGGVAGGAEDGGSEEGCAVHGQGVAAAGADHAADVVGDRTLEAGAGIHRGGVEAGRVAGQIPERSVGGGGRVFRQRRHGGKSRRSGAVDTADGGGRTRVGDHGQPAVGGL